MSEARTPTRLEAYMRKNPLQWKWWTTKNGGYVLALGGWKVFYGRCADCDVLVTTRRRYVVNGRARATGAGRWPTYCRECSQQRNEAHNKGGTERQQERRRRLKAARDAEYRRLGMPLPKPGRPKGGSR